MKRWHVVNTQSRQEARALENLRRQGFTAWLPMHRQTRRHARRVDCVLSPLFPGYLFVRLDSGVDRWRSINGTFGVLRLITEGDLPLPVPEGIVEEIQAHCNGDGISTVRPRDFVPGQSVRVIDGPFAELDALFLEPAGTVRVVLLFNLLGRKVRATVPLADLAA